MDLLPMVTFTLKKDFFFGVPFGIKDIFNTKNLKTEFGSVLYKNFFPGNNSRLVDIILNKQGIGARPFFWPMHKQKVLNKLKLIKSKNFPNSEYISKYGLYIPSSLSLKNSEIDYISNKINSILN